MDESLVTPDFDVAPAPLREYYRHLDQRLEELQGLLGAQGAVLPSTYEKYLHGSVPAGAGGNPLVSAKEYYEQLKQLRADSQARARAPAACGGASSGGKQRGQATGASKPGRTPPRRGAHRTPPPAAGLLPGGARGVPRPAVGGCGRGGPRRVHFCPLYPHHHRGAPAPPPRPPARRGEPAGQLLLVPLPSDGRRCRGCWRGGRLC